MYCQNCGNYNEEDAVFCGSCGIPLKNIAEGRTGTGNEQLNGDFFRKRDRTESAGAAKRSACGSGSGKKEK